MNLRTALLAAVCIAAGAPIASASPVEERTCRGSLGAVTVVNLRVPQGAKCTLQGTIVQGKIRVLRNGTLKASRLRVVGSIQSENHRLVSVRGSRVGDSIQLVQGAAATVIGNIVGGDIQLFENRRAQVVRGNRVDGNLQCKENRLRPTGSGNRVGGTKEDQCRRL